MTSVIVQFGSFTSLLQSTKREDRDGEVNWFSEGTRLSPNHAYAQAYPWYARAWRCGACGIIMFREGETLSIDDYNRAARCLPLSAEAVADTERRLHEDLALYVREKDGFIIRYKMVLRAGEPSWIACLMRHPGPGWRVPIRSRTEEE